MDLFHWIYFIGSISLDLSDNVKQVHHHRGAGRVHVPRAPGVSARGPARARGAENTLYYLLIIIYIIALLRTIVLPRQALKYN